MATKRELSEGKLKEWEKLVESKKFPLMDKILEFRKKHELEELVGLYQRFIEPVKSEDMRDYLNKELALAKALHGLDVTLTPEQMDLVLKQIEYIRGVINK